MKTKILDQIRGSEQGMLQLLEELVNIDSGADALAGINAVAQRIGAFLEVLGFTVEYLETDGAPVHTKFQFHISLRQKKQQIISCLLKRSMRTCLM